MAALAARDEAMRTGVYSLVGQDPDNPTRDRVYVGEMNNVSKRLVEHEKDTEEDSWTRTLVVVSKD